MINVLAAAAKLRWLGLQSDPEYADEIVDHAQNMREFTVGKLSLGRGVSVFYSRPETPWVKEIFVFACLFDRNREFRPMLYVSLRHEEERRVTVERWGRGLRTPPLNSVDHFPNRPEVTS